MSSRGVLVLGLDELRLAHAKVNRSIDDALADLSLLLDAPRTVPALVERELVRVRLRSLVELRRMIRRRLAAIDK